MISVRLTLDEARRIANPNIDLDELEILRWRRRVRDAVRHYDTARAAEAQFYGPTVLDERGEK